MTVEEGRSEITVVFSQRYGEDLYEIRRISFDGIRKSKGFRRPVRITRHQYLVNGNVWAKADWMNLKGAAERAR